MIYFDYTATTPVNEEVLASYIQTTKTYWGNPSSLHKFGVKADNLLNLARKQMCELIDADNHDVIFTASATEASNLAIKGVAHRYQERGKHLITTIVEHPSVYNTFLSLEKAGFDVTFLDVDKSGRVNIEDLKKAIRKDTILVSMMYVNNEIGTIMPVYEVGEILKDYYKIVFHVDIVQAIGKTPVSLSKMHADLASISAHKIYGLKGSGALFVRRGVELEPQTLGGSQEYNLRAGTVDVPSAVAFAKAMRLILTDLDKNYEYVKMLNEKMRTILSAYDQFVINSPAEQCSPYIINFSLRGIKGETFVHALEKNEIYVSTKSACSSKNNKASRVLLAIGRDQELASNEIRISLSHLTTLEELDIFNKVLRKVIQELT